jgi:vacuolar iron transporter family protein
VRANTKAEPLSRKRKEVRIHEGGRIIGHVHRPKTPYKEASGFRMGQPAKGGAAMRSVHKESHLVGRIGLLRAAVLGANDRIISTASLILGVAAAAAAKGDMLLAGIAGLAAGAMSMAAGEYVSVSSQSDTEEADLARERRELAEAPEAEREELAQIYVARGVEPALARQVADQLMGKDALEAHARDELGVSEITTARPVQAALTSAATFSAGAAAPLAMVLVSPPGILIPAVAGGSLVFLALLGWLGARAGGADVVKPIARVTFWGALAMAITAGIGALVGTAV